MAPEGGAHTHTHRQIKNTHTHACTEPPYRHPKANPLFIFAASLCMRIYTCAHHQQIYSYVYGRAYMCVHRWSQICKICIYNRSTGGAVERPGAAGCAGGGACEEGREVYTYTASAVALSEFVSFNRSPLLAIAPLNPLRYQAVRVPVKGRGPRPDRGPFVGWPLHHRKLWAQSTTQARRIDRAYGIACLNRGPEAHLWSRRRIRRRRVCIRTRLQRRKRKEVDSKNELCRCIHMYVLRV